MVAAVAVLVSLAAAALWISVAWQRPVEIDTGASMHAKAEQERQLDAIPQLLIVGVQKCGTSALYFALCLHPQVACAAYVKEPFHLSSQATDNFIHE